MTREITGKTKLLALIGSPVGHSASPQMYNYAFELLGLDYVYTAFDIREEEAGKAIEAMRTFKMQGGNVTMPDKIAVMPYLDQISEEARLIGAVNTIVNQDGTLTGYCTDGEGFLLNLKAHDVEVGGKHMVIAGAGGAATAIQVQSALAGAGHIVILKRKNHTFEKALLTAEKLRKAMPSCQVEVIDQNDKDAVCAAVSVCDILVNATSVGMAPDADQSIIADPDILKEHMVVADIVYNPLETRLLADARKKGCRTIGGKGMLLWQGVRAFELFTGEKMPVAQVAKRYFD